ncbi:C-type lectin-like [Littorina saxatilis]|uniref:C-type lectin-like n=1 Tax=Littorina saxatilis TaxID=31220 RepID=UPI0038B4A237
MMERPCFLLGLLELCLFVVIAEGSTCPSGWIENTKHRSCVRAYNSDKSWYDARDACSKEDATLVHVDSDDVKIFLATSIGTSNVLSSEEEYWISSNDIIQEDHLRSVFGQSIAYTSWESDQPNDASQNGGPHTQNCVIDVLSTDVNKQEDKKCSEKHPYICEMWLPNLNAAPKLFTRTDISSDAFQNYGLAPEAADVFPAVNRIGCGATCLQRYYYCDVFVFSSQLRLCKLLRLYEKDESANALSDEDVKLLDQQGYVAFVLQIPI